MRWKGLQYDSWKDGYILYLDGSWIPRPALVDPRSGGGREIGTNLGWGLESWHLNVGNMDMFSRLFASRMTLAMVSTGVRSHEGSWQKGKSKEDKLACFSF